MLKDARRGKFQVLVVWALDRFGRSMVGNLRDVLELDRLGVQVVSVRESWLDTGSPVRTLLIAIFSWVAEQERSRLIERTKAGVAAARRRGARLGRPRAPEFVPGVCRKLACKPSIRSRTRRSPTPTSYFAPPAPQDAFPTVTQTLWRTDHGKTSLAVHSVVSAERSLVPA
jgi:DNA invertase Pin-like site-specific DNA recombinase